jgi:hypothetical protein
MAQAQLVSTTPISAKKSYASPIQEQQLATMQAMMINQQHALARNDASAR